MGGAPGMLMTSAASSAASIDLTDGYDASVVEIPPEYGGGSFAVGGVYGFILAAGGPNSVQVGAITPATWLTYPVYGIYQLADSAGTTHFVVYGDAHVLTPALSVAGVNQNLGAGSFTSAGSAAVTFTAATDVVNWSSHGMANGTPVMFTSTTALPAALTTGKVYYVVSRTTNTFKLALTVGGAAIDIADAGTGTHTGYNQPTTTFNGTATNPFAGDNSHKTVAIA